MKLLTLIIFGASAHAMQPLDHNLKKLDKIALSEFIETKKQIVSIAEKKVDEYKNNQLVNYYDAFSQLSIDQLGQILAQESFQTKVRDLYNKLNSQITYQEALKKALQEKSDINWQEFRTLNGKLLQHELSLKGVNLPEKDDTQQYLELNKELNPEAGSYVIAASYLIFHARQMQRNETGKPIPQLILN